MRPTIALLALTVFSASAIAATPAEQSAPQRTSGALQLAANNQLPNKGKALTVINASIYTYLELAQGNKTIWIAAPTVAAKKGDIIRFDEGSPMANFYSKSLNRTFEQIYFVGKAVVSSEKE
jgi:hypothetical protein